MDTLHFKPEIENLERYHHGDDAIKYDAIDFSANINPLGPPKEIQGFIKTIDSEHLKLYPDTECTELRKTLSKSLQISSDNIIVGNGSMEILRLLCQSFLKKGDEALIPVPTFSEYERMVKIHEGRCKFALMKDLKIDSSYVINSIGKKTKILFLCNPNNPTGFYEDTISEIIETVKKNVLIFLDEAFIDFTSKKSFISNINQNLFILRSTTKIYSIPALRCGFGISDKKIINYMKKAATPWNVNYVAQKTVIKALKNKKFIEKTRKYLKKEKKYIISEIEKIPSFVIYPSDTNFFLIKSLDIPSKVLKKDLLKKGFLIRDCSNFRGLNEHYIRICVRTHQDNKTLIEELRTLDAT